MRALELTITAMTGQRYAEFLHIRLIQAHKIIGSPLRELSLALVGDRRMSSMHKRFMGIDGPTDVLTFPLEFDSRRRPSAAEVVVCVPQARRQATARGTRIESELLLYAIHGLLHLSGFDDRTPRDYQRMHRLEDTILRQLGLGPVFAPQSASRRGGGRRS